MNTHLSNIIHQQNPWLQDPQKPIISPDHYIKRLQFALLAKPDWDSLCTVLIGPRQAGKTTLGKHLSHHLISTKRYTQLLYLNCDAHEIREWLRSASFLTDIEKNFSLKNYILFIDEVQRLETPGLLLKLIIDLKLPIKLIASGSSQLEIKSKVQEHLTGRQIEVLILPLSCREINFSRDYLTILQYGSYPQIYLAEQKTIFLQELFNNYIQKDVIEFLQIGKADVMKKLIGLLAQASGQLINYQQLGADCQVSTSTVQHYISVLEQTYVIKIIRPYVGNKRTELTSNPICYFLDNGFRNQALNNFSPIENRTDNGLLVENCVFQELLKYDMQERRLWQIYYWRTKAGAEVDFILQTQFDTVIPIEVKYRNAKKLQLTRSYQSFLEAYQPKLGIIITKNQMGKLDFKQTEVHFIPLADLPMAIEMISPDRL